MKKITLLNLNNGQEDVIELSDEQAETINGVPLNVIFSEEVAVAGILAMAGEAKKRANSDKDFKRLKAMKDRGLSVIVTNGGAA